MHQCHELWDVEAASSWVVREGFQGRWHLRWSLQIGQKFNHREYIKIRGIPDGEGIDKETEVNTRGSIDFRLVRI